MTASTLSIDTTSFRHDVSSSHSHETRP